MYQYILEGITLSVLCVFGILTNIFAMVYFGKQKLRKQSFYGFMFALSTTDLFFSVTCLCSFSIPALGRCKGYKSDDCYVPYDFWQCLVWLVPISNIFRTGSIYLTVALSIERYLVICRPLLYNSKSWISTKAVVIGIIVFSISLNLTKFFESEWGKEKFLFNQTVYEEEEPSIIETNLVKYISNNTYFLNTSYIQIYIIWCDLIFHGLIPFTLLIVLNVFVLKEMIRYRKRSKGDLIEEQKRFSQVYMAKFNIVVVTLFIVCYSLHFVPVIYRSHNMDLEDELILDHNIINEPEWIWDIISLSRVLEAFNSSVAFTWFLFKHRMIEKFILNSKCFCFSNRKNSSSSR